jgi:hypothetical protein
MEKPGQAWENEDSREASRAGQGKTCTEIQAMWNECDYRTGVQRQADEIDALIVEFNEDVGLI